MKPLSGEVRDLPFLKNDMKDYPRTTARPLDTADAPGKADSEIGIPEDDSASAPSVSVDVDDALILEPRDQVFRDT